MDHAAGKTDVGAAIEYRISVSWVVTQPDCYSRRASTANVGQCRFLATYSTGETTSYRNARVTNQQRSSAGYRYSACVSGWPAL